MVTGNVVRGTLPCIAAAEKFSGNPGHFTGNLIGMGTDASPLLMVKQLDCSGGYFLYLREILKRLFHGHEYTFLLESIEGIINIPMKKIVVLSFLFIALCVIVFYIFRNVQTVDPRGDVYAGSVTCQKCHRDIYASYPHTAHYLASSPASPGTVHGSFSAGTNVVVMDDSQRVVMEKTDSGLFQAYYVRGKL